MPSLILATNQNILRPDPSQRRQRVPDSKPLGLSTYLVKGENILGANIIEEKERLYQEYWKVTSSGVGGLLDMACLIDDSSEEPGYITA
jgi:hypothetical protein